MKGREFIMARKKYKYEIAFQKRAMSLVKKKNENNRWSFKGWGEVYHNLINQNIEEINKFKNSGVEFVLKNVNTIDRDETYNRFHKFFTTKNKDKYNKYFGKKQVEYKNETLTLDELLEKFKIGEVTFEELSNIVKFKRESDTEYLKYYGTKHAK